MPLTRSIPFGRLLPLLLTAALLAGPVRADDKELSRIDDIYALSNTNNPEALTQLAALRASLPANASYIVRREILTAMVELLCDGGKLAECDKANTELMELAEKNKDLTTALIARIGTTDKLIDDNKTDQAIAELAKIEASLPPNTNEQVQYVLQLRLGRIQSQLGQFEKSLRHFLKALSLTDRLGRITPFARVNTLITISRLYLSMKNPEKALRTTEEALAYAKEHTVGPKLMAALSYTQGTELTALDRGPEAIAALERALAFSESSGMGAIESEILGNMADHYLKQKQFVEAERVARKALLKSEKIGYQTSILMAKANIGFALGGQGKISQASTLR